jgi:hypothetical protein
MVYIAFWPIGTALAHSSISCANKSRAGMVRHRATLCPAHSDRNPALPSFAAAVRIGLVKMFWTG